jgi:hypothetical protein
MGFVLSQYAADRPHEPLSAEEAVRLKTLIYIAADAGTHPSFGWGESPDGPKLKDLASAVMKTGIASSMRASYDALNMSVREWQRKLVAFRCGLSRSEVLRHRGTLKGWDCRDLKIVIERISFDDVDPAMQARLHKIPTRLALKKEEADLAVEAGRQAVRNNPSLRAAIASVTLRGPVLAAAE